MSEIEELSPEEARRALFAQGVVGDWILDAHQTVVYDKLRALSHGTNEALVFCSRQWGKSFLNQVMALEWLMETAYDHSVKPRIARVAAPKKNQCEEIVETALEPILAHAPPGLVVRDKSRMRWRIGRSSLRIGTTERAHVNTLRGGNAGLIILEEGGFVDSDDYEYAVKSVVSPQLLRSGGRLVHVTTPSEDENHYIHAEVIPKTQLMESFFSYDIYTNTALSPEQIEKAAQLCGGKESDAWKREYLVKIFRSATSVAVPEFDDKLHVRAFELPAHYHAIIAADVGGMIDKTAGYFIAYDFESDKMLVWDESAHDPGTPSRDHVKGFKALEEGKSKHIVHRVADGSGQNLLDLRIEHKWEASLPPKTDFEGALKKLRSGVGKGRVIVHPRCKLLVQTLKWGKLNKQGTDFARTKALGHCDAVAALMYGYRVMDLLSGENPAPKEWQNPATTRIVRETESQESLVRLAKMFEKADRRRRG
jgi:hypothetical protein